MRIHLYIWRIEPAGHYAHNYTFTKWAAKTHCTHTLVVSSGHCSFKCWQSKYHNTHIEEDAPVYTWAMALLLAGEATLIPVGGEIR
jgi:hypothetical protein